MARRLYGPSSDFHAEVVATGDAVPGAEFRFYNAETGGTQWTNLQTVGGSPVSGGVVVADAYGYPPLFYSDPSGPGYMWADAGAGRRVRVYSLDLADKIAALEAGMLAKADATALAGVQAELDALEATVQAIDTSGGGGGGGSTGGLPVFNIRSDYGAVGNGSTNDSGHIQDALDAANSAGGGIVFCPPGFIYGIGTTLRVYANTTFYLAAGATLRRIAAVTIMINGVTSPVGPGGYNGRSNITVCGGGTVDHRGVVQTNPNNCFTFAHAQNIAVRDITIKDQSGYHSIELNGVRTARISNVRFLGYVENGAGAYRECVQLDVAANEASTTVPPYDQTMCDDIKVEGCYAGVSGTTGTTAPNCLIGGHSATVGARHRDVRVTGNQCDDLTYWAASGYAITGFVFTGNQITGCAGGVRIDTIDTGDPDDTINTSGTQTNASQDERAAVIAGNTFTDTGTTGFHVIQVFGEATGKTLGASITGNAINGATSGARGINCLYTEDLTISGNTIRSVNGSGIYLDTCPGSEVTGNTVRSAGGTGIFATACDGIGISDNVVRSPGSDGIQVSSSSNFEITDNKVRLTGTHGINVLTSCSDFHVADNLVKGAGRDTDNTSAAFRTSATCTRGTWTDNRSRREGSGNEYKNGFSATSTCTAMWVHHNYFQAGASTGSAMDDQSTGGSNTDNLAAA